MAVFKGSAYETTRPFAPAEEGPSFTGPSFSGLRERPIPAPEPVLEHSVSIGDRLDALGQHYYANPRDWRRLADCNPDALFAEDLLHPPAPKPGELLPEKVGEVLSVPRRKEGAR